MVFKIKRRVGFRKPAVKPLVLTGLAFFVFGGTLVTGYVFADKPTLSAPVVLEVDPNIGVRARVEEFFLDNEAPEMLRVIACESQFKHFDNDGSVLKNRAGSSAVGVAQILTSKHPDPKAVALYNRRHNTDLSVADFDLWSLEGNLGYALLLYEIRGVRDWECAHKLGLL